MATEPIKHVIWDWNGTLVDDAWLFVELMNEELLDRNLPLINIRKYKQHFTFPVKVYYERLGFDFKKENFDDVVYNFIQKYIKRRFEPHLFENTKLVLNNIYKLNITQSIISAQENTLLTQSVKYFVTDYPQKFDELGSRFLGRKLNNVKLISLM